jgi:hypothetical protein
MDALKPNPFISEVEKLLASLGLDVEKAKHVVPNGVLLYFNFNEIPLYICLPSMIPSDYSNITRIEAEVAELNETDAGQLVVGITSYISVHDCTPVRVTTRRSEHQNVKVMIGFVCDLQFLRVGSLAPILLHICELADQMRTELVTESKI